MEIPKGYYALKIESITPPKAKAFDDVKPEVIAMAVKKKRTDAAREIVEKLEKDIGPTTQLAPIAAKARVVVPTRDVVAHQLLKHTIMVENFDSDADALLDAAIELHEKLTKAAVDEGLSVTPKALYVVEKSRSEEHTSELQSH